MLKVRILTLRSVLLFSTLPVLAAIAELCIIQAVRTDRAESRAIIAELNLIACRDKNTTNEIIDARLKQSAQGFWILSNEIETFLRRTSYAQ